MLIDLLVFVGKGSHTGKNNEEQLTTELSSQADMIDDPRRPLWDWEGRADRDAQNETVSVRLTHECIIHHHHN
jgi:hypothetical protein